jgi:hypothetical protein
MKWRYSRDEDKPGNKCKVEGKGLPSLRRCEYYHKDESEDSNNLGARVKLVNEAAKVTIVVKKAMFHLSPRLLLC